jgi:hypothetical protein
MPTRKIPVSEATKDELRAFALELGITNLPPSYNRDQVLSRIRQSAWNGDYIEIEDVPQNDARAVLDRISKAAAEEGDTFVRLNIHVSELDNGSEPVYVSCNGRGCLLPRGEDITIPTRLYESLKNAVMDVYDPLKEGGISTTPRKVPRFPHAVLARNLPASESSMKRVAA